MLIMTSHFTFETKEEILFKLLDVKKFDLMSKRYRILIGSRCYENLLKQRVHLSQIYCSELLTFKRNML